MVKKTETFGLPAASRTRIPHGTRAVPRNRHSSDCGRMAISALAVSVPGDEHPQDSCDSKTSFNLFSARTCRLLAADRSIPSTCAVSALERLRSNGE